MPNFRTCNLLWSRQSDSNRRPGHYKLSGESTVKIGQQNEPASSSFLQPKMYKMHNAPQNLLTNRLRFGAFSCLSVRNEKFHELVGISLAPRELERILIGYPAWIRTKNNASKGRCVTVTPRGMRTSDLDWRFSIRAQCPIFKRQQHGSAATRRENQG